MASCDDDRLDSDVRENGPGSLRQLVVQVPSAKEHDEYRKD
jgi:hypothetical protein